MISLAPARRALAGAVLIGAAALAAPAQAATPIFAYFNLEIEETITQLSPDSWRYSFTLINTTLPLSDAEFVTNLSKLNTYVLPYYADAGITGVTTATGWTFSTDSGNPFGLNTAGTMAFTATEGYALAAGASLAGFSYVSSYGPAKAPYQAVFAGGTLFGDPSIPASPGALADGLVPTPVPEPASYAMLLAGLAALASRTRRRS